MTSILTHNYSKLTKNIKEQTMISLLAFCDCINCVIIFLIWMHDKEERNIN